MGNNILRMENFAGVKDDGEGVLGKILYYSLSNILIDKTKMAEICADIGFPYMVSKRVALVDAFRSATGDIYQSKVVEDYGDKRTIKVYCRDNKSKSGEISRELVKETLDSRTNHYKKLANFTFSKDFGMSYSDVAYRTSEITQDGIVKAVLSKRA